MDTCTTNNKETNSREEQVAEILEESVDVTAAFGLSLFKPTTDFEEMRQIITTVREMLEGIKIPLGGKAKVARRILETLANVLEEGLKASEMSREDRILKVLNFLIPKAEADIKELVNHTWEVEDVAALIQEADILLKYIVAGLTTICLSIAERDGLGMDYESLKSLHDDAQKLVNLVDGSPYKQYLEGVEGVKEVVNDLREGLETVNEANSLINQLKMINQVLMPLTTQAVDEAKSPTHPQKKITSSLEANLLRNEVRKLQEIKLEVDDDLKKEIETLEGWVDQLTHKLESL